MENGHRFKLLFNDLSNALSSFEKSLTVNLIKTIKKYFEVKREMKIIYPKEVIKAYFIEEAITEETYLTLKGCPGKQEFIKSYL